MLTALTNACRLLQSACLQVAAFILNACILTNLPPEITLKSPVRCLALPAGATASKSAMPRASAAQILPRMLTHNQLLSRPCLPPAE